MNDVVPASPQNSVESKERVPETVEASKTAETGRESFEQAANQQQLSLLQEFLLFLREHKAWWLTPILLALGLIFLAAWFSTSAAAPFIYPFL